MSTEYSEGREYIIYKPKYQSTKKRGLTTGNLALISLLIQLNLFHRHTHLIFHAILPIIFLQLSQLIKINSES